MEKYHEYCNLKKNIWHRKISSSDDILKLEQNLTEDKTRELEKLKLELTVLRQIKVKGAVIRSRATNLLEGEKPTKYFCTLETHNYLSKIIPKLETSDGRILTDQHDILKESENFYKDLGWISRKVLKHGISLVLRYVLYSYLSLFYL